MPGNNWLLVAGDRGPKTQEIGDRRLAAGSQREEGTGDRVNVSSVSTDVEEIGER